RATYNQPFAYRPEGPVDWERFRASLRRTMACHPALRSLFEGGDEGPVQRVVPIDSVPVPWSVEPAVDEAAIGAALLAHARVPFDLTTAPLWRATLFPAAAPHGVLLLNFHHAIIDLWSIDLLLQELAGPEAEESDGERPPVEASRFRLPGLVPAERDRCVGFWRETLADATGELAWPGRWSSWDGGRTGGSHRFGIDAEASAALHRMAVETGATTFQILLAVFHGWLHRVTGTDDVVVGTPVSLRSTPEVQASVNCFLNTLPVRIRWGDEGIAGRAFTDLVGHVRETFLAAVSHGDLPFDEIVAAATEGRAGERSPIVTTVFVHTEKGPTAAWLGGVRCEPIPVDTGTAKFDLTLFLEGDGAALKGAFEYDRRRFDEPTIAGYAASFSTFFRSLLSAPAEPLERAALLSADERQRVVHDWNDTATDLGPPASLQGLFAAQVLRSPGTVALDCGGESLSYLQLAERVNRLARFLRSRGVGPDVPVAVCLERSVEMVVALLGIVTAGGAYLPLDPEVPPARLSTMLASASPPVVLVQDRFADRVAAATGEVFRLDEQRQELAAFDDGPLDDIAGPDDLAYVIYTSGSTGAPKGVMNTHAGIVNRLRWMQDAYGIGAGDRVLQKTPFGFDVSVWEFFWPLLTGATVVMAPPGLHREPTALADLVDAAGITVIHFV
ncbi:MAG: AMP-binding protein, partial [Planctomycetota bacterium]